MRAAHYRSREKIQGLCLKQLCRARSASGLHKGLAEASMATESEFKVSLHLSVCFSPAGVVPQTTPRETPWIQVSVPESISRELVPEVGVDVKDKEYRELGLELDKLSREEIDVICDNRRILDGSYSEMIVYS